MNFKVLIVLGRYIFSAFTISIFTWVEVAPHFFSKKCHATFHKFLKLRVTYQTHRSLEFYVNKQSFNYSEHFKILKIFVAFVVKYQVKLTRILMFL